MITGNEPIGVLRNSAGHATRVTIPGNEDMPYGMTIRHYYAGLAMQGLQSIFSSLEMADIYQERAQKFGVTLHEHIAALAVRQADALIEALNKK